MSDSINYVININGDAAAKLTKITGAATAGIDKISGLSAKLKSLGDCMFAVNNIADAISNLQGALNSAIQPGVDLNTSITDLSAITGVTGIKLKEIEGYARSAAKTFGGSAAQGVESYKLILSQLGPEIANVPTALSAMGNSVSLLSKTMGGDTVAATEVLTTAMNQFQVSLADPTIASKTMADMMNVMSAAARVGSAELPAIKSALENSGMAAKMAGVSFEELNASIQVLDKAGKKGAEGGVAIRNALSILAEGRFMPEKTQKALLSAGIDVEALGDKSKSLSDRLRLLQPVLDDSALMTLIFGRENANAGIALISGVNTIEQYTKAITGTNAAQEQAGIVMGSYAEKMSRLKAKFDDMKISVFNLAKGALPYFTSAAQIAQGVTSALTLWNLFACVSETALGRAIASRTKKMWQAIPATWAMISSQGTWLGVSLLAAVATRVLTNAVQGLGRAIYSIPIIGWIALGISLLAGLFMMLWDKSEKFRQILFSVWETVKAVFYNIGIVIKGLWENIVKPYFSLIYDLWKMVIGGMIAGAVWLWNGLASVFTAVGQFIYEWVVLPVYNGINAAIQGVSTFFLKIWTWISGVFSGVASWLSKNLLEPIKGVFSQLWDFIGGILNNIINALMKPIQWIKELWNKVFPKDQFKDINVAYKVGAEKGTKSWAESQKKKKEDGNPLASLLDNSNGGIAGVALPGMAPAIKGNGNKEGDKVKNATDAIATGGTRNSNTTITFKNLIENIVFDGNLADKKADLQRELESAVLRVLAMAQATG